MRSVLLTVLALIALGLYWSLVRPSSYFTLVESLDDPDSNALAAETALREGGPAATLALEHGLRSDEPLIRLRCARVLALRNDARGEQILLDALREHGVDSGDPLGAQAEAFLLAIWDQRAGPDSVFRKRLARIPAGEGRDEQILPVLDELLNTFPSWVQGYALRSSLQYNLGRALESRQDALIALMLDPNHFDALTHLARAQLLLNAPEQAWRSLQWAVHINPRLKERLKNDIEEVEKALDAERERRRKERRKETKIA